MPKIVAFAYDANLTHANEIYGGIAESVAHDRLDWQLIPLHYAFEAELIKLSESRRLDGAIGSFISDSWVARLTERGVRAINLGHLSRISTIPVVSTDDRELGRDAARHLIHHGAISLAYLGKGRSPQNELRVEGMQATANRAIPRIGSASGQAEVDLSPLIRLARPVGVLCSSDRLARELIQALSAAAFSLGPDALVVGIGDETAESLFAGVEISSFRLPNHEIGRRAAALLAEQLASPFTSRPVSETLIPAALMARASSLPTPAARLASRIERLIEDRFPDPAIDVAALAQHLGTSRRSLEIALRAERQDSPYQMLSRKRGAKACELLTETDLAVGEVGERCGYPEPHHFSAWFKQRYGQSPRQYRQERITRQTTREPQRPWTSHPNSRDSRQR